MAITSESLGDYGDKDQTDVKLIEYGKQLSFSSLYKQQKRLFIAIIMTKTVKNQL